MFVTSDHHFYHANIIKYCNRPFSSVEEMNSTLIEKWNNKVSPKSIVWYLGDFSFSKDHEENRKLIKSLNGHIHFVLGNHDKGLQQELKYFKSVQHYAEIKYSKKRFILMHYPIMSWNGMRKQSIHCHGHSHGTGNDFNIGMNRFDIGVDNWNYEPVHLDEIIQRLV